jgi:hypothetical protein
MKSPLEQPIDKIRRDCLLLFEQSVGFEFRIKGSPLMDICDGVNWKDQHVIGQKYGNFHIDLCELTGKENKIKEN